ncbi:MAG: cysteine peptidase family C39 domain-containing protein [Terriglobia bacterium]
MNPNFLFIPALAMAGTFFWVSANLRKRVIRPAGTILLWVASGILALPSLLMAFYYLHLFDNAAWFYEFRAMPFSELSASGAGFLAGMLHSEGSQNSLTRRLVPPLLLFFVLMIPFAKPIFSSVDFGQFKNQWLGDVCLQSTPSSCGPASAASVLKSFGLEASERELAKECFTYTGGTENWFLARALRRRGFEVQFEVKADTQGQIPIHAIAGVTLPSGAGHFVAVLSETATDYVLGDPLKGTVLLPKHVVSKHYRFTGFFMIILPKDTSGARVTWRVPTAKFAVCVFS